MPDGGLGLDFALLQREATRNGLTLDYHNGYYQLTHLGRCLGHYLSLGRVEYALSIFDPADLDDDPRLRL